MSELANGLGDQVTDRIGDELMVPNQSSAPRGSITHRTSATHPLKPKALKDSEIPKAKGYYAIAQGWVKRGRIVHAINNLRRAIDLDPTFLDPYISLGEILMHQRRWDDLVSLARLGLKYHFEVAELHKMQITGLAEIGSMDDAFAAYRLERRDNRDLLLDPGTILCFVTVRNERVRLPYFLYYYRRLGVDRFFFVDNMSSDGTPDWLLEQHDVRLWQSSLPFKAATYGAAWFENLAQRYGIGHWLVTVDADEFLVFDGSPNRTLKDFCGDLEARGSYAATGLLVDMYSNRPVAQTVYREGDNPLSHCPYFDRRVWHTRYDDGGQYRNQTIFFGGARQRVFRDDNDYLLSKAPLVYYLPNTTLNSGQHLTNYPADRIAQQQVALLHFKFFSSLPSLARSEATRQMHAMSAAQYKAYARTLDGRPDVTLYDPGISTRYTGTAILRALGAMNSEEREESAMRQIMPVYLPEGANRPFWSVMITVYDRIENVERTVSSVLSQACDDMQIQVIGDSIDATRNDKLRAIVERVGCGRVEVFAQPGKLGHPHIFNLCIDRARGQWVHILHDDDWVLPGFYATLRDAIETASDVGAAFCHHTVVNRTNSAVWHSWVERETIGIIDGWLSRIATECRVQFSAMTVKRSVYEQLGGFCSAALSAFDWEMWVRIGASYPVLFVPDSLAVVSRDDRAESARLWSSGVQITDAFQAIRVIASSLPQDCRDRLVAKARERIALYAVTLAREHLHRGDLAGGLANLKAALTGHPTPRVRRIVEQALRGVDDEFAS